MKRTRRIAQLGFLALTLAGVFLLGGNAERWCPLGGVEALYTYAAEGNMICSLGTSNFFILGGVLVMTLLLRRAFCGYMCPIGAISEWVHALARRTGIASLHVPDRLDRLLAPLKYAVLAAILFFTWRAGELLFRACDPCYALISRHGTDITIWAYVAAGAILLVSLVIVLPFCRWLCPFAAVLHLFSRFGLARIKRDSATCTSCRQCAKACPMAIPVDRLRQVTAARCIACMSCLEACPHRQSDTIVWGPADRLGRRWSQAVLVLVLLLCTAGAVSAAYMFPLPSFVKSRDVPPPEEIAAVRLKIENVSCRGRANYLWWFLDRDDMDRIPGWLKVEAWPGPGMVDVHVSYDPAKTDAEAVKRAITEWYFDAVQNRWRESPFRIQGYDPLGLGSETPREPPPSSL